MHKFVVPDHIKYSYQVSFYPVVKDMVIKEGVLHFSDFLKNSMLTEADLTRLDSIRKVWKADPQKDPAVLNHMRDGLLNHEEVTLQCGLKLIKTSKDYLLPYNLCGRQMWCSMLGLYNVAVKLLNDGGARGLRLLETVMTVDYARQNSLIHVTFGQIVEVLKLIGTELGMGNRSKFSNYCIGGKYKRGSSFWFCMDENGSPRMVYTYATCLSRYLLNVKNDPDVKTITFDLLWDGMNLFNQMDHVTLDPMNFQWGIQEVGTVEVVEIKVQQAELVEMPEQFKDKIILRVPTWYNEIWPLNKKEDVELYTQTKTRWYALPFQDEKFVFELEMCDSYIHSRNESIMFEGVDYAKYSAKSRLHPVLVDSEGYLILDLYPIITKRICYMNQDTGYRISLQLKIIRSYCPYNPSLITLFTARSYFQDRKKGLNVMFLLYERGEVYHVIKAVECLILDVDEEENYYPDAYDKI